MITKKTTIEAVHKVTAGETIGITPTIQTVTTVTTGHTTPIDQTQAAIREITQDLIREIFYGITPDHYTTTMTEILF